MKRFVAPALALVAAALFAPGAHAAGPWRAQVVDAETGQPLDGVVVVFVFIKYHSSLAGSAGAEYYGADEAVTGPDGRFEIPARMLWNPIRIFTEVRVEITIFKPGYGRHRIRRTPQQREEWRERRDWWQILELDDMIVELPPLKTREERLKFYDGLSMYHKVPPEGIARFFEAEARERAYLGLSPRR